VGRIKNVMQGKASFSTLDVWYSDSSGGGGGDNRGWSIVKSVKEEEGSQQMDRRPEVKSSGVTWYKSTGWNGCGNLCAPMDEMWCWL